MEVKEIRQWYNLVIRARDTSKETGDQVLQALKKAKFYEPRGNGNKAYKRLMKIRKAYDN
jgi:hypothetical protein